LEIWLAILLTVVVAIVTGVACFLAGVSHRKKIAEAEIGSAEAEAKRIVEEAVKEAEAKKKEYVLEGKDEVHQFRNETEKELNARRKEVQRQERRVQQKEETLDRKMDNLEKKEDNVSKKLKQAEDRLAEAESVKKSQLDVLERLSGFTSEQAKEYLLNSLEAELTHEKAVRIMDYEQKLREEADKRARNIIFELMSHNYIPVIAHPERYDYLKKDPEKVKEYIDLGALLQGNYLSLLGKYGRHAKKTLKYYVKKDYITFFGSDIHRDIDDFKSEKFKKVLWKLVKKDQAKFDDLYFGNISKIINNDEIKKGRKE